MGLGSTIYNLIAETFGFPLVPKNVAALNIQPSYYIEKQLRTNYYPWWRIGSYIDMTFTTEINHVLQLGNRFGERPHPTTGHVPAKP
jgi:hypothetical protein